MNKVNQNVPKGKASSEVFKSPKWVQRFAPITKQKAIIRLSILLIITVFLGLQIPKIKFDYDFNSFFPEGDEELAYYERLNDSFGEFNDFLFIVLKSEEPTSSAFLKETYETIDSLNRILKVLEVQSLFDLRRIQITPFGINQVNLVHPKSDIEANESLSKILSGKFLGRDENSMLLMLRHEAFQTKKAGDLFYNELNNYLKSIYGHEFLISGKIQMQYDFTRKFEKELANLLTIALAFAILILLLLFKSFKGVVIPILTLVICIVWTMGFISLSGKAIDVMVVIIPAILLIVSLSDVIHLINKYDEFKREGKKASEALYASILFIGKANFLTTITTCFGFLSLLVIPIQPIQDFGLYTACGVLFAFLITFILIPCLLFFFPKPVERTNNNNFWSAFLTNLFVKVVRRRKAVMRVTVIISGILISGSTFLRMNTSILVGFQKGEPELEQVAYFDDSFDGYKPFELGIQVLGNREIIDRDVLLAIEEIESYLTNSYGVSHVESPLNLIKEINAGIYGGSENHLEIPKQQDIKRVRRIYYSPKLKESRQLFEIENEQMIRLFGRSKDLGSSEARILNEKLLDFLSTRKHLSILEVRLTGTSYLIDKTDNYIVNALIKGLGFATLTISILLLIFFKNWRLVFVSLIPNLLPVIILFGLMGLFSIDLNISTAVIFTVAFGIAVDDSIHMIVRYYMEKRKGTSPIWAMKRTVAGTGKSIIVTSLVILGGFSLFMTSGLSSPFYLGMFISITAMVALILDLTVLPLLILGISKKD
ncbi:efflux RND transporter permease subunit [Roseivirga sp.]|uniref:efflux RND transporter permease subunit n=1 Tax=Roseivirga sp. TaxID=1964215 RepID=UPI003B8AF448